MKAEVNFVGLDVLRLPIVLIKLIKGFQIIINSGKSLESELILPIMS